MIEGKGKCRKALIVELHKQAKIQDPADYKKFESKTEGKWRIKPQQSTNIMDLSWYSMSDSFIIQRERDMTNLGKS